MHTTNSIKQSQFFGSALASLSAILYGLMAYFGTLLLQDHFTLANMLFWRFAIATLWIIASMIVLRKPFMITADKGTIIQTLIVAGLMYSGASALYFLSMTYIGTGMATAIFFSFPVFVTLFTSIFTRTVINQYTVMALVCICLGVALVKGQHAGNVDFQGTVIAISAAFLYAIYIYRSRAISKIIDPYFLTLLVCAGTMAVFFCYGYATHQLELPANATDWFYVCAIGILATALPIQFLLASLKYITPIKVSILASLRVVVTIVIGWALLNETMSVLQFTGVATILFAAMIAQRVN